MSEELLATSIGKWRNLLHRPLKQRYAAEAEVRLTVEEFILPNMIEAHTDRIPQNVAIATGKNRSVVMRMIDSLEQKGLVRRTVNPVDRRENLLSITDLGASVLLQHQQIERRLSGELPEGIPSEKVAVSSKWSGFLSERAQELHRFLIAISFCLQTQPYINIKIRSFLACIFPGMLLQEQRL